MLVGRGIIWLSTTEYSEIELQNCFGWGEGDMDTILVGILKNFGVFE